MPIDIAITPNDLRHHARLFGLRCRVEQTRPEGFLGLMLCWLLEGSLPCFPGELTVLDNVVVLRVEVGPGSRALLPLTTVREAWAEIDKLHLMEGSEERHLLTLEMQRFLRQANEEDTHAGDSP